jgi:hypothetical protein
MIILYAVLGAFAIAILASMLAAWVLIGGVVGGLSSALEKPNELL